VSKIVRGLGLEEFGSALVLGHTAPPHHVGKHAGMSVAELAL